MTPDEFIDRLCTNRDRRLVSHTPHVQTDVLRQILTEYFKTEEGREKIAGSMTQPARQWRDNPDHWININENLEELENFLT